MRQEYTKGRTIYVKEEDWKLVKRYCWKHGFTIGYFIGDLIKEFLKENEVH